MAPCSSATLLNGQITLPLAKFSHCTVLKLDSIFQWIHLKGQNDLFAVFDAVREKNFSEQMMEKHVLKILHGSTLLVGEIDLTQPNIYALNS